MAGRVDACTYSFLTDWPMASLTRPGKTRQSPRSGVAPQRRPGFPGVRWRRVRIAADTDKRPTMDIERINAIGTLLADLASRTEALRGYL